MQKTFAEIIVSRLKEPSTYAGLAGLLSALHFTNAPQWADVISYVGAAAGGTLAMFLPEGK